MMLDLDGIDRTDDRPPYRQIAAILRQQIKSGRLAAGEKLPSESALIEHFGVARMTVRQAVQELRGEGLVIPEHGKGVFVRSAPPVRRLASDRFARRHRDAGKSAFLAETEAAGQKPQVDRIRVTNEPAGADIARRLRLTEGDRIVVRSRRYLADGRPVEIATSFIPESIAKGTPIAATDTGPGGIYGRIEDAGHTLARFVEEVSARMPTPDERKALDLGAGTPVITLTRTAFDAEGTAVEVCDTVKAASAFVLEYDFPAR
ncbi:MULTISPECIES: GntR family transcriptional regulator [Actinoalloteichus]|uniref:Transcriptional regulator n=1 Tax=Actinoalloteichus fjordicus TaxID=1612552 RepID=A0AAC9L9C9_9PSEU|nr:MULTISPECIES: GntR family transcriptional regulator [Actinoalloteichus]APU12250.1 transcriptional regulator [Actinoalloteichus fjordicus]APU18202.1 transcriptional regulator [Actinoalloteichus sp. GBA129-24]